MKLFRLPPALIELFGYLSLGFKQNVFSRSCVNHLYHLLHPYGIAKHSGRISDKAVNDTAVIAERRLISGIMMMHVIYMITQLSFFNTAVHMLYGDLRRLLAYSVGKTDDLLRAMQKGISVVPNADKQNTSKGIVYLTVTAVRTGGGMNVVIAGNKLIRKKIVAEHRH